MVWIMGATTGLILFGGMHGIRFKAAFKWILVVKANLGSEHMKKTLVNTF